MTAWSLANLIIAPEVEALLDKNDSLGPEDARAFPRDKALSVIHAALWAYGSRSDSTAGAYAFLNLMEALGVKRWSFKDDWSDIKINGAAIAECLHKCEAERKALATDLSAAIARAERAEAERDNATREASRLRRDGEWYQHVKRGGIYSIVGTAKLQTETPLSDMAEVTIYVSHKDGELWARPPSEFNDGRFIGPLPRGHKTDEEIVGETNG